MGMWVTKRRRGGLSAHDLPVRLCLVCCQAISSTDIPPSPQPVKFLSLVLLIDHILLCIKQVHIRAPLCFSISLLFGILLSFSINSSAALAPFSPVFRLAVLYPMHHFPQVSSSSLALDI